MTDTVIWSIVIVAGLAALGLFELARSGKLSGPKLRKIRATALAVGILLLGLVSGVLAVAWALLFFAEVWQYLLIFLGSVAGLAVMVTLFFRQRPVFYVSALVLAFALIWIVL